MSVRSPGQLEHRLDRFALRVAGRRPGPRKVSVRVSDPVEADAETMTRSGVIKRFGAAAALSLLPWGWLNRPAQARPDCFNPCLGIVKAASDRNLGKCRPPTAGYALGNAFLSSVVCAIDNTRRLEKGRRQCYEPECGKLADLIENGGTIDGFPVVPIDLPAGTQEECGNCEAAGGYCGVCPKGSSGFTGDTGFFCGTPGVQPCRYCGGC